MRLIIAGSRTFDDYLKLDYEVRDFFYDLHEFLNCTIISGTANGADKLGEKLAENWQLKLEKYPANWDKYGKKAGYIRNEEMANNADALIAFWDGQSKGTKHMIDIAKKKNLITKIIRY